MMHQFFIGLLLVSIIVCYNLGDNSQLRHYNGYSVIRVVPESEQQLMHIHNLTFQSPNEIDFWTVPSLINKPVDVMVAPQAMNKIVSYFNNQSLKQEVLIKDIERLIKQERESLDDDELGSLVFRTRDQYELNSFFEEYRNLNKIFSFIELLHSSYPEIVSYESIGRSSEGRELRVIKIQAKDSNRTKPIIFIDAGIHAREWISVSTALYIANKLVTLHNSDSSTKELMKEFDWYILPVVNPDGYEYTQTRDRMWRKTRSTTNSLWGCKGVDLNRNFEFHWNEVGASDNPCSEIYAGPVAFSEPESRAVRNFMLNNRDRIMIYLAIHSYSQVWLTPWGWTSDLPPNYSDLEEKAQVAVKALKEVYGTNYQVGTSTNVLYAAAGGADDWAFGVAKVKYVYTIELRDSGRYGFLLPKNQIKPTGEETWVGVKALALKVAQTIKK